MPPSPQPFSQRWTPEDTRQQVEAPDFPRHGTPAEQHHWRQHVLAPLDENLGQAIGEHLAWLLSQGVDVLPPHSDRLETPLLRAFRGLINAPEDREAQIEAGRPFVNHLSLYFYVHKDRLKDPAFHDELVAHISAGNFESLCGDRQTCAATGLRVNYNFHNWQGVAGQILFLDPDRPYRSTFEPLAPETLAPPQTYTATIPVPSGVLLIADWIRIPAFGELAKPVDDDEPGDALASTEGRAQRTVRYAERLGVVHAFVQSPGIVASLGAVTAGYLHRDQDSGEAIEPPGLKGQIHASLRWTTMVDRQHLVDLITPALGAEEAERQVSDLEQGKGHYAGERVIRVEVTPGMHHLYFSGDERTFASTIGQSFASQGLYLEEDFQSPGLALTEEPLQPLAPKAATARKPGPR